MPDTQPTDREVIELLAGRVMGWKVESGEDGGFWNPLESIADAFEMQAAIPREKRTAYRNALSGAIEATKDPRREAISATVGDLIYATARQRSMAAYEVFKDA